MTSALLLLLVVRVQAFNLPAFKAPLRRQPLRAAAEALVDGAPPAEEDGVIIPLGCGAAEWHPKPTSRV